MEFDFFDVDVDSVNKNANRKIKTVNNSAADVNKKPQRTRKTRQSGGNLYTLSVNKNDLDIILYLRSRRKQGCNQFNTTAKAIDDFLFRVEEFVRKEVK